MASRRSRQPRSSTVVSDDQILSLVSKLRQLVPEIYQSQSRKLSASKFLQETEIYQSQSRKLSASKFLQETCNYIRSLQREVDDISERLSHLLSTMDADTAEASLIASLIIC